jgi:polysaccharide biosynthesis transport protein
VLNRLVDGSLIVARLGTVEIEQLKTLRQFLLQSGHRVLGLVMNGVEVKRDRHPSLVLPWVDRGKLLKTH